MKRGHEPFKSFGISQTYPQQEGKKCAYARCQDADFGVKMSWESWFCRDISPKFAKCKESAQGRGPMSGEVGGKGGIRTVNPDHPRRKPPQVADEEGWKHKRRLSRGEISLLLAPHPPPPLTSDHPLLTPQGANSEEASGVARKFKVRRTLKFHNMSTSKASIALRTHWRHYIKSEVVL